MRDLFTPRALAAAMLSIVIAAASFPGHAIISSLASRGCDGPIGTLRIVEPDDGMGAWATYGLPAPTRMLRVMANDSKCFTILDRGAGFAAAQAERELAMGGLLQEDQNIGDGQILGADFILIPDIVSQNEHAGGSQIGGSASGEGGGFRRGLFSAMTTVATMGVTGRMNSRKQTADVVLTLVDVRTSQQLASVSGEAKITDRAWSSALAASSPQGRGNLHAGRWENTEIGKVILKAYEDAFAEMVRELQRNPPRSHLQARQAAPDPVAGLASAAGSVPEAILPDATVPDAPEAAVIRPGASVLAGAGTLVMRRLARLLAQPSIQADVVTELREGMLVFPTGASEGALLEVEDEMGNRGWVPSAAVEVAV